MMCARVFRTGAVLGLAVIFAGCSAFSTTDSQAPSVSTPPAPASRPAPAARPPARPPQPSTSSAWKPLLEKADQAAARGDYEQALAFLERAQRIDPESGEIYLQMARTHRAKGNAAQARATAERGMLYCGNTKQCDALRSLVQ